MTCPECGKILTQKETTCPYCGRVCTEVLTFQKQKKILITVWLLAAVAVFLTLFFFFGDQIIHFFTSFIEEEIRLTPSFLPPLKTWDFTQFSTDFPHKIFSIVENQLFYFYLN